ncbi:MAG: hypothetical protein VKO65_06785 [Cyanobacteriota bacterium]|nr:hypothetical protein [Cyanobacteriota bacterium]
MPTTTPIAGTTATATPETRETADGLEEPPERPDPGSNRGSGGSASDDSALLSQPLGALGGMAIALLTLAVPLASVVMDRQVPAPAGFQTSLQR